MTNYEQTIAGYPWPTSVNLGESIEFFVDTTAEQYSIAIYRSGYYGGTGGRLIQTVGDLPGKEQPDCHIEYDTGLASCSAWTSSYTLTIPEDWVSGVYIAKLTNQDTGGENFMVFVVRDDERNSEILFQTSLFTHHAYNGYGGKSVYDFNSGQCATVSTAPRGVKVSMQRPFGSDFNFDNVYFTAEYSMVRWLEAQGYDLTYSTNLDTHYSGKPGAKNELLDHQVFLSVGHDEYWTQEIRDAITAARDAGVHLGFFTANTGYWRVRLEPDPVTGEPDAVIVTYKTTESGPADPSGHATSTWRDPAGVNNPENALIGVQYIGDNDRLFFPMRITAEHAKHEIYRHTALQAMPQGTYINVGDKTFGWEWDATADNGLAPAGLEILAETPVYGFLLQNEGTFSKGNVGKAVAQTTLYTAPSGALVFASGTIHWSWGLGAQSVRVINPDPIIQQITYNVLADMGLQPQTPNEQLVLDGQDGIVPIDENALRRIEEDVDPVISNVQAKTTSTTITVSWDTDTPAIGQVWYGDRAGHTINEIEPDADYVTTHSLTVEGLAPNSTYYYRLVSIDEGWRISLSEEGSVTTQSVGMIDQVKNSIEPITLWARCWARANRSLIPVIGIAGVAVAAAIVVLIIWFIQRRRRLKAV